MLYFCSKVQKLQFFLKIMSIQPSPDQDLAAIQRHIEDRQWQLTVNTSVKKVHFLEKPCKPRL